MFVSPRCVLADPGRGRGLGLQYRSAGSLDQRGPRGGYGSARLLPDLPLADAPLTAFVGFSDLTSVHGAMQALGRVSIHAPVLTQFGRQPQEVRDYLFRLLESPEAPPPLTGTATFTRSSAALSDADANALLDRLFALRRQQSELDERFRPRLAAVLPPQKVLLFYELNVILDSVVNYDLAGMLPLAR